LIKEAVISEILRMYGITKYFFFVSMSVSLIFLELLFYLWLEIVYY